MSFVPPGFRFHPTDIELLLYYLYRKNNGLSIPYCVIPTVDLYQFEPWQLPAMSSMDGCDWYFFCPCDQKYKNSSRRNRATKGGYWKSTGRDKLVLNQSKNNFNDALAMAEIKEKAKNDIVPNAEGEHRSDIVSSEMHNSSESSNCSSSGSNGVVGRRKTLVYYSGKAPSGVCTNWVMNEYILENSSKKGTKDVFVICRISNKRKENHDRSPPIERTPSDQDEGICLDLGL